MVLVPAEASIEDNVSSVSDGTKIMKAPESIGPVIRGSSIFVQRAADPLPEAAQASSMAGSTVSRAVVLPLICMTRYLVI